MVAIAATSAAVCVALPQREASQWPPLLVLLALLLVILYFVARATFRTRWVQLDAKKRTVNRLTRWLWLAPTVVARPFDAVRCVTIATAEHLDNARRGIVLRPTWKSYPLTLAFKDGSTLPLGDEIGRDEANALGQRVADLLGVELEQRSDGSARRGRQS